MSLLETDDEFGQRKHAEKALRMRNGTREPAKYGLHKAKKPPQIGFGRHQHEDPPAPLHKDGGGLSSGVTKKYKPKQRGAARGRLVAHAAASNVPQDIRHEPRVLHKGGGSEVNAKIVPPVFNAPRCAEVFDKKVGSQIQR